MKLFKRTIILFCIVAAIICFWLVPGINHATDTRYTRLYEDTNLKNIVPTDTSRTKHVKQKVVHTGPVAYKRESIKPAAGMKKLKPRMFSRAMQFEPELVEIDSTSNKKFVPVNNIIKADNSTAGDSMATVK